MNSKKKTAAEVYIETEERGPDPAFATSRAQTVAEVLASREAKRVAKTAESAVKDWRGLANRRRDGGPKGG